MHICHAFFKQRKYTLENYGTLAPRVLVAFSRFLCHSKKCMDDNPKYISFLFQPYTFNLAGLENHTLDKLCYFVVSFDPLSPL